MSDDKAPNQPPNVPVFYADSIIGFGAGAYTSRVILACQDGLSNSATTHSLALVMPTQALYAMGLHIVAMLSSDDSIQTMKKLHAGFEQMLSDPAMALRTVKDDQTDE